MNVMKKRLSKHPTVRDDISSEEEPESRTDAIEAYTNIGTIEEEDPDVIMETDEEPKEDSEEDSEEESEEESN